MCWQITARGYNTVIIFQATARGAFQVLDIVSYINVFKHCSITPTSYTAKPDTFSSLLRVAAAKESEFPSEFLAVCFSEFTLSWKRVLRNVLVLVQFSLPPSTGRYHVAAGAPAEWRTPVYGQHLVVVVVRRSAGHVQLQGHRPAGCGRLGTVWIRLQLWVHVSVCSLTVGSLQALV